MIQLQETNDITPICPHCEAELGSILTRSIRSALGRRYVYFCAGCRRVLGISHRKGFWMG